VVGAPDWVNGSERFDVDAKGFEGATLEQLKTMLMAMLAERFHLTAHREMRNQSTYDLTVARPDGRLGPQLRKYSGDCQAATDARRAGRTPPELPTPSNGAAPCGMMVRGQVISAGGIPMANLAATLRGGVGRTVIDHTQLEGAYEFTLTLSPDVEVVTAVREQLGLKLEPSTTPLPVLVVDRIDRPTPN
jgi:uncharacterized protein (TIGR03435 family)